MNNEELSAYINSDQIDKVLTKTICSSDVTAEKKRYHSLLDKAVDLFGNGDYHFVSSPGRTEIGGNHTDHQHGHVVAATLSVDNVCVCKKNADNSVCFIDPNFGEFRLNIDDLSIHEDEKNTTNALIRGIGARLKEQGYQIGGFSAVCDSRVLIGASISSSACFEVMIVEIFSALYNENRVDAVTRALIGQYAENVYFGKPSGLLDQLTISVGGFVAIDFKDPNKPVIENYDFSFADYGYKFLIVNTKGDHSNLSHEYAAITSEIKEVAHELGVEYLADSSYEKLLEKLSLIKTKVKNDRAILRAIHFYGEDKRAIDEKNAINNKDIKQLLKLMVDSGHSSYMYLQNVFASSNPKSQGIALACALSDLYLNGEGAYRVQGGGFEGTIIAAVPNNLVDGYKALMAKAFGDDAILDLAIRPVGTITVV